MKGFRQILKRSCVLLIAFMLITSGSQTFASRQHLSSGTDSQREWTQFQPNNKRELTTCPSGQSMPEIQRRDVWGFSGSSYFSCVGAKLGGSGSIYTLNKSLEAGCTVISKINPNLISAVWSTSFNSYTEGVVMALLKDESKLYITTPNTVDVLLEIDATNGNLVQSKSLNGIKSGGYLFLRMSSDESTLFYTSFQSLNTNPTVCRLTLSSMTGTCYAFTDMKQIYGFELGINSEVYFYGVHSAAPNNLRYVKFDALNNAVIWNNVIACPGSSCSSYIATFLVNSQGTLVYAINDLQVFPNSFVMLTVFDVNTGAVLGNRYKTDELCSYPTDLYSHKTKIYGVFSCQYDTYLIEYDEGSETITQSYKIKYMLTVTLGETSSDKLMLLGRDLSYLYSVIVTTFTSSIASHPDITTSTSILNTIASGEIEPVLTATATPTTIALNPSSTTITLTTHTYAYEPPKSYIDDVSYQVEAQTIDTLRPSEPFLVTPKMTCSITGAMDITYILQAYQSDPLPPWLSIDPNTGDLSGTAPAVAAETTFSFYVNSTVTSTSTSSVNLVNLVVKVEEEASQFAEEMAITTQVVLGATVAISLSLSSISCQSPRDMWFMFNQLQLLMLFLLVDMYIPVDIRYMIKTEKFVMFNFAFIPAVETPGISTVSDELEVEQPNENLADIGYESRSTYNNNLSLLLLLLLIVLIHLIVKLIPIGRLPANGSESRLRGIWRSIKLKIVEIIYYGTYARLLLEAFENLVLSSLSELDIFDTSKAAYTVSIVIAFSVVLFSVFMMGVTIYYFIKYFKEFDPEHKFFMMETFADLRNNKWARLYTPLFMLRILIFVFIIVIFYKGGSIFVLVFCLIIQIIYCCLVVRLRPFSEKYKNIIEIMNETYYVILISFLLICRTKVDWTPSLTKAYMYLILSNLVGMLLVLIIVLVYTIIAKFREKARKKKELRYMEETPITADNINNNEEEVEEEKVNVSDRSLSKKTKQNLINTMDLDRIFIAQTPLEMHCIDDHLVHPNYCDGDEGLDIDD